MAAAQPLTTSGVLGDAIAAWRHTAEIHADPELLAILRKDGQDLGEVPAPGAGPA